MLADDLQTFPFVEPLLLSPIEAMFWRIEEQSTGAFRVAIVLRMDGYINVALLEKSLQRLPYRHPKLRAFVTRSQDGHLRYEFNRRAPMIPLEVVEFHEPESPWQDTIRALLQKEFPATGPLVWVAVLRNSLSCCSELVVAVHHAVADGLSAILIIDDLLSEYARMEENSDTPQRGALTAITVMRAKSLGTWTGRLRVLRRAIHLQIEERRSRQTPLPAAYDVPPQSQWVHWVFSREETLALIRRCRTEQSSISGALVAAVCLGLADNLPSNEALFKCQYPLNIREALGSPQRQITDQDLGCFVSIMNDFQKLSPKLSFWELARRAHGSLELFRKGGGPSLSYNLAAIVGSQVFQRASPKVLGSSGKRVTLLATNYGVVNLRSTYGSLRPKACTLTLNNNGEGPSLLIEALVLGQQLNLGLAADQLDPPFWAALQGAVRHHLNGALRSSAPDKTSPAS